MVCTLFLHGDCILHHIFKDVYFRVEFVGSKALKLSCHWMAVLLFQASKPLDQYITLNIIFMPESSIFQCLLSCSWAVL